VNSIRMIEMDDSAYHRVVSRHRARVHPSDPSSFLSIYLCTDSDPKPMSGYDGTRADRS